MGHVWTAPSWQGFSSRVQHWSVQPCVRPLSAVHVTAGHNALRGSGPGQKDAFDDALAHVGCPDRRIDRLCITCCSPSQPSHHTGCPMRSGSRRQRSGLLVSLAFGHHRPRHPGDLVGERDGHDLRRPPRQQCCEPRSMFGAVDFGIADHCQRAGREQAAQIAIASFADNCRACLCRHSSSASAPSPIQAEKSRPDRNTFGSAMLATRAVANAGPTPGMSSSRRLASLDRCQTLIIRSNSRI